MPLKNLFSHVQDALGHALSGIDAQGRRERRRASQDGDQTPPRTLVSGQHYE